MKLLINAKEIYVEHNSKEVLNIEKLEIFDQQKIGLIGKNGAGKTTLMNVLMNKVEYEGSVERYGEFELINQVTKEEKEVSYSDVTSLFDVNTESENRSGGEETRLKVSNALSSLAHGIFADEPTSFLDQEGIELLATQFKYYYGALLVVSHDRYFLDEVVDTIWELEDGKINVYEGNYSNYLEMKEREKALETKECEEILEKKRRLEKSAQKKRLEAQAVAKRNRQNKSKNNTKDGGRLSHQKDSGTKEKKMYQAAKSIEKEIESINVQSVKSSRSIKLRTPETVSLNNPYPIVGRDLTKSYGDNTIFDDANFEVMLNKKVALVGDNGAGKTTLMKMILNKEEGIVLAPKIKIGYFSQNAFQYNHELSVIEYMSDGIEGSEGHLRSVLYGIGFTTKDITKKLSVLSGGEIMKLTLTRLMMEEYNVLLLDEPTNFLDIESIEVIERLIKDYEGTILYISHDHHFIKSTADIVYEIENHLIRDITLNYLGND